MTSSYTAFTALVLRAQNCNFMFIESRKIQIMTITRDGETRFIPIENPIGLLNYRLATGEITMDEYAEIIQRLSN